MPSRLALTGMTQSARWMAGALHRLLGLAVAMPLVVAGLTGTLLSFYMELDGVLDPRLAQAHRGAAPSSYEAVYRALARLPTAPGGYWKMEIPPAGGPVTTRYYIPGRPTDMTRTRMVTVDPVTLRVVRDAYWRNTVFTWIYDLHMNLLFGPLGKIAMGVVALASFMVLMAGVATWALPRGSLRSKLLVKRGAASPRRIYDIHKIVGLSAMPILIVSMLTAAIICLPGPSHALLGLVAPLATPPVVRSRPQPGAVRLPIDRALAIGAARFPGATTVWVRIPGGPLDPYDIQMRQAGAPMTRFPRTHVWLDQYDGRVLAVHDPQTNTFGDIVLDWVQPLHDGKAFGLAGRLIVMVAGLAQAALVITGVLRWRHKRRSLARSKVRRLRSARL